MPLGKPQRRVLRGAPGPARGLAHFPGMPAGWDQPLAEVIESPFHLSRVRDEQTSASCLTGAMARAGGAAGPDSKASGEGRGRDLGNFRDLSTRFQWRKS